MTADWPVRLMGGGRPSWSGVTGTRIVNTVHHLILIRGRICQLWIRYIAVGGDNAGDTESVNKRIAI